MLSEERIKEATNNLIKCHSEGLIRKEEFRQIVFDTYSRNHNESLKLAERIFKENLSNLWAIVISYYSMFYIANAVLYKLGYKVREKFAHRITADALIVHARHKLKSNLIKEYNIAAEEALSISDNLVENFNSERAKRAKFQYESTEEIKRVKAETSLKRAKEFSEELKKLL
ncbi:hypothetical protein J4468_00270 [Candidatus Woesearchaeota archaeon]|nr:hypothetical protein [Candidatus Woesearchaeota archaeon]